MRTLTATLAAVLCAAACSNDAPRSQIRSVGASCLNDSGCSLNVACATGMPGGMCTYTCGGDPCPAGAVCADLRASGSGLICATECSAQSDCRSGYTCCPGLGACVPAANCPPQSRPASADLGLACGAGCLPGEICAGNPNPEFPGGACTAACNPNDQSTCPANGKCVSTSTGSFCFPLCAGGCSAPLSSCVDGACRAPGGSPACTPPGTPMVVLGGVSGPATAPGACDPAHAAPVGTPALAAQNLGTQSVGSVVTFSVPAGAGSLSILSQGANVPVSSITLGTANPQVFPNSVVPSLVRNPSNSLVYDDTAQTPADPSGNEIFYGGLSPFTGMMTVPNTSASLLHAGVAGGLQPGTWQFTVNDFALECTQFSNCSPNSPPGTPPGTYDVQVLFKPGLPAATGTVDVAFYFIGGGITSAAAAQKSQAFNRMLQTLGTFYANAGLCLGKVTLYDVPMWAQTQFGGMINADDESPCGNLAQMFTLSAPGNQINFFFVNGFKSSTGTGLNVVGIDGTIPGPSSLGGNVSSGASVNGSDLIFNIGCGANIDVINCGADEIAYIVAHEGGHFMGLYHVTEQTGDSFDPLSDTPTCACTSCAPPSQQASCRTRNPTTSTPTLVRNGSCLRPPSCGGGDNLMFWLLDSTSSGALSPHQGQVMRSNLVVR
jgi:hypothetical protein